MRKLRRMFCPGRLLAIRSPMGHGAICWCKNGDRDCIGEAEVEIGDDGTEVATGAIRSEQIKPNVEGLSIADEEDEPVCIHTVDCWCGRCHICDGGIEA